MLLKIYSQLLEAYGSRNWWPVRHGLKPREWEIMAGAILTQNTAWRNVEKALENLAKAGILDRESLLDLPESRLAELIRPSGYFNQKARKLRILAGFKGEPTREGLLSLWGIGPETADSILLYAYSKPEFVVDAYTRRIFSRLGMIKSDSSYEEIKSLFQDNLPDDIEIYKEYHALIVKLAKENCRNKPVCKNCPIEDFCNKANV
jgi:endonuclease-3 related protein